MRYTALALSIPLVIVCVMLGYYYVRFARLIDESLHGERQRVLPRVLARPLELRRGQSLTERQLIDRLNDLGYAQRSRLDKPGEFAVSSLAIAIQPRLADLKGQVVRVMFQKPAEVKPPAKGKPPPKPVKAPDRVARLELGAHAVEKVTLDAPVLTALIGGEREKQRQVALSAIPPHVKNAVLAIEDHRFYEHPGVDPIGIVGAAISNLRGNRQYTAGGSTITQQVARNVFLPKMFPEMTLQAAREK